MQNRIKLSKLKYLKLFSDSCYGQNKNMNMISMLAAFKAQFMPELIIKYYFPIRGHSFLPADKVFGRIQQALRKINSILIPEVYLEIMAKFGRILVYNKDFKALNFKHTTSMFVESQRGFKISEARVINIDDKIGLADSYNGDFKYFNVLKNSKKWADFRVSLLPSQTTVTPAKKTDVIFLLDAIGVNDITRSFYTDILAKTARKCDENDDEF